MKLGEGGEAFFVFETLDDIPQNLQTSPVVSPTTSPREAVADVALPPTLPEPDFLDLATDGTIDRNIHLNPLARPGLTVEDRGQSEMGVFGTMSQTRCLTDYSRASDNVVFFS